MKSIKELPQHLHEKFKDKTEKSWYALYVSPRKEKVVEKRLSEEGYEVYLPLRKELHQWKDRKKMVDMPLIPSYIFPHIHKSDIYRIVPMPDCLRFIYFEKEPASIPDCQIESMKILLSSDFEIKVNNVLSLKKGDKVKILEGQFAGACGTIKNSGNKNTFAVTIDTLSIDLNVTIDSSMLKVQKINQEKI